MNVTAFSFLIFLFILNGLYYIFPKKYQWLLLLGASFCFLFYKGFTYLALFYILLVLFTTYFGALLIQKYSGTKKAFLICFLSILIILAELGYLKYTNLFGNTIASIINFFGGNYRFQNIYRHAPLGISYYSLIMIGYLVNVYRGEVAPQKNIFKCALLMLYFPIVSAGPFIRYEMVADDLYGHHGFDLKKITSGFTRILWGFFKMLVISSRLGIFVDNVYGNLNVLNGWYAIVACLFYTLELYTNFSGAIDIIMGASEMLGINLPENFNNPFFSKSITEFWRRWHITLGLWLKDFVFYPLLKSNFMQNLTLKTKKLLGKKWGKKLPLYLSMLILWLLIGIWHGGAYHYILASGLLQFIFIMLEDLLSPLQEKIITKLKINPKATSYKLWACAKTFLLFSFSMIFFRAASVNEGFQIIKAMGSFNIDFKLLSLTSLNHFDFIIIFFALVILFGVELKQRTGSIREKLQKQNIILRWSLIYALFLIIIIFGIYGIGFDISEFVYSKF